MRVLILLLIIASACSRTETSEPAEKAPEPVAETSTEPSADEQTTSAPPRGLEALPQLEVEPTIELSDAGKTPRKAYRATLTAGEKRLIRVSSGWTIQTMYGPLVKTTAEMPSVVYELATEVKKAGAQGAEVGFRVKDIKVTGGEEVKPAKVKSVEKVASSLKGASGTVSFDAHGIVNAFSIDARADSSLLLTDMVNQIQQALRTASLPLPTEPMGKGAKWTVTQTVEQRTAKLTQTTTFELVTVKKERVEVKAEHTATAPEQVLKLPGSRSGATFGLTKVELVGTREGTWTPGKLGSASATDETGSVLMMTASAPKREAVIMALETKLDVEAVR